jgi:hypothetical protein
VGAGDVGWTIFPGSPSGDELEELAPDVELEVELALALDFGFCAQGGRPDWSWLNAIPPKSSAGTARSKEKARRKGLIDIDS